MKEKPTSFGAPGNGVGTLKKKPLTAREKEMNKTQRIAGFFGTITIMVALLVTVSVFLLNGCSKETAKPTKTEPVKTEPAKSEPATKIEKISEMKVEDDDGSTGMIHVYARRDGHVVAYYASETNPDATFFTNYLEYENSRGSEVFIELDRDDNVVRVLVLGTNYHCSYQENANLCKKASEKVAYWKSIMKWDERVPRILNELKKRKPEDELD